jgi:hypothetical protein
MTDRAFLERLSRELTDKGKLIEAGWVGLRLAAVPLDAPAIQLEEMRNAFFAGAQHLFGSIMTILDPGEEPTEADMKRLDLIQEELQGFINDFQARRIKTKGNA